MKHPYRLRMPFSAFNIDRNPGSKFFMLAQFPSRSRIGYPDLSIPSTGKIDVFSLRGPPVYYTPIGLGASRGSPHQNLHLTSHWFRQEGPLSQCCLGVGSCSQLRSSPRQNTHTFHSSHRNTAPLLHHPTTLLPLNTTTNVLNSQ
jgi:hypothetical protein